MKVGINLLFLIPGKVGGSETYSRGIVNALNKNKGDYELVLFCNKENYGSFKDIKKVLVPINASNRLLRIIFEQLVLPFYLILYKIDVIYSLGYIAPFFCKSKSIVNIFDLNWHYHPEDFGFFSRTIWEFLVRGSAMFSDAITTTSLSSKKSITKILKVRKKIMVVYPGPSTLDKSEDKKFLKKNKIIKPYFFTLSALYPHKNLIGLLESFKFFLDHGGKASLVIAGLGGKSNNEVMRYISDNRMYKDVKILGYVEDLFLSTLYKNTEAFIFTSKYEGFGMPILEAFKFSTPVISSNAYSLKEVVQLNGEQIDPMDIKKFADKMSRILRDKRYKRNMIIKSRNGQKRFSWEVSANKLSKLFTNLHEAK